MKLPKFTTRNGGVEEGAPKARLATKPSSQGYDWLFGEAASKHPAGARLSETAAPERRASQKIADFGYCEPPVSGIPGSDHPVRARIRHRAMNNRNHDERL